MSEPADRRLLVDGVELEARLWSAGIGTPVVLLHEGLGSVSAWGSFPASLAEACGRDVIAYSRQGYGRSQGWPGARPADYLAREALRLPQILAAVELNRAILFGHSDGGAIALETAARHPDHVAGLLLEAAHVTVEPSTRAAVRSVGRRWSEGDLRDRLARHHDVPEQAYAGWHDTWISDAFRHWSITALLPAIRCPVLAVRGAEDSFSSERQLALIAQGVPQVQAVTLPGCGHVPHKEARERMIALIAPLIARL